MNKNFKVMVLFLIFTVVCFSSDLRSCNQTDIIQVSNNFIELQKANNLLSLDDYIKNDCQLNNCTLVNFYIKPTSGSADNYVGDDFYYEVVLTPIGKNILLSDFQVSVVSLDTPSLVSNGNVPASYPHLILEMGKSYTLSPRKKCNLSIFDVFQFVTASTYGLNLTTSNSDSLVFYTYINGSQPSYTFSRNGQLLWFDAMPRWEKSSSDFQKQQTETNDKLNQNMLILTLLTVFLAAIQLLLPLLNDLTMKKWLLTEAQISILLWNAENIARLLGKKKLVRFNPIPLQRLKENTYKSLSYEIGSCLSSITDLEIDSTDLTAASASEHFSEAYEKMSRLNEKISDEIKKCDMHINGLKLISVFLFFFLVYLYLLSKPL